MGIKCKLTGLLIRFALDALIDLRQEREREETGEGIRMMWTKEKGEAVVVIEEVNEAIETVRVIDTETETENAVVREMAKEPTAVTDMMVQMADMVTGIVIAKGTEMTIVSAGARGGTIMRDLNVVRTIESKEKNQKYLTIYRRRHHLAHHRLVYHPHLVIVLVPFVRLTEETAKSTRHQEAGVMVAVMPMMMI